MSFHHVAAFAALTGVGIKWSFGEQLHKVGIGRLAAVHLPVATDKELSGHL